MRWARAAVVVLGLALLASGCGDDSEPLPDLAGIGWVLLADSLDRPVPDGANPIDATFEEELVQGSSGCNSYGAEYTAGDDGTLEIGEIAGTLIGCPPAVADVEAEYLRRLDSVRGYRFEGDKLVLVDGDDTELLRFTPA